MCSFGSCQTRFEFLSQFRKVRDAFECFVTQVQTHLPKTKRVWPMKINVPIYFVLRSVKLFVILGFNRRNDSYDPTLVAEDTTFNLKCIKCHPMSEMIDLSLHHLPDKL